MMPTDPFKEEYSKENKLMRWLKNLGGLSPEEKKARAQQRKARDVASFGGNPTMVIPPTVAATSPVARPSLATAHAATLGEPPMAVSHSVATPGSATKVTPEYGSSLRAESRYKNPIARVTVNPATDYDMEGRDTRYGTAGGFITVHGGDRVNRSGRGTMSPNGVAGGRAGGRSARRPGIIPYESPEEKAAARAAKRGDGINSLGLISREKAKEMGLGVNQWRSLNEQILSNKGTMGRQELANEGAITLSNIQSATDLQELFAKQNDPRAKAELQALFKDLELAPLRKTLMEQQSGILARDLAGGKKKKSESRDITDEIIDVRNDLTPLGFMRP